MRADTELSIGQLGLWCPLPSKNLYKNNTFFEPVIV